MRLKAWTLGFALGFLGALASNCGSPPPCTAASCQGCCDAAGACQSSGNAACGLAGAACTACAADQVCARGSCLRTRPDGGDPCAATCLGCCASDICFPGDKLGICGVLGARCQACNPATEACRPQTGGGGVCVGPDLDGGVTLLGDPCSQDPNCAGIPNGICRRTTSTGQPYLGGFCTVDCSVSGLCPAGATCVRGAGNFGETASLCWPACGGPAADKCRKPGYACFGLSLDDGGFGNGCWIDPPAPPGLEGAACAPDAGSSVCGGGSGTFAPPLTGRCAGPLLDDGGWSAFPGGSCYADCGSWLNGGQALGDAYCGDGGICIALGTGAFCFQACSTPNASRGECRSAYVCHATPDHPASQGFCQASCDAPGQGCPPGQTCAPLPGGGAVCTGGAGDAGVAQVGDACAAPADCAALGAGALCRLTTSTNTAYLNGFCTLDCGATGVCPSGSACVPGRGRYGETASLCWPACAAGKCRSPGYRCYAAVLGDGGAAGNDCWIDPPAPAGLEGAACTPGPQCGGLDASTPPPTGSCRSAVLTDGGPSGWPGGACTADCSGWLAAGQAFGNAYCGDGGACVGGACYQACNTPGTGPGGCRTGYLCSAGSGTPGLGYCRARCDQPGAACSGAQRCDAGYCT